LYILKREYKKLKKVHQKSWKKP